MFSKINFRGVEGYLLEGRRLKREEVREGLYYYHIREDEDCQPISVEDIVWVNYWGTICFKESIDHLLEESEINSNKLYTDLTEEEQNDFWIAANEPEEELLISEL